MEENSGDIKEDGKWKGCLPGFRISGDVIPGMNIMKPTFLALFNWLVSLF
jgi:hypothetical protein